MPLGILEDRVLEHVPGTSVLNDDQVALSQRQSRAGLKKDKTGTIILVPQPSNDPNDPLNWPLWRRDMILAILSFISVICATASALLAANSVSIAIWFKQSFTSAALLTGYHLAGVGVAGFIFVASARVWGKRHLFLLGCILMIASSAWGGASKYSYPSLLWARIFQGVALAPFEALVNTCVGDLYYVHERGPRMALTNVALFGGAFLTPVIAGRISWDMGWWWTFYFMAIFLGGAFPLLLFFCPETAYKRPAYLNTDIDDDSSQTEKHSLSSASNPPEEDQQLESAVMEEGPPPPKVSFVKSLLPFNGRKSSDNFWKLLIRPFPLFFHPAILWACLTQGCIIGWTVMVGVTLSAVFLGPPLWFQEDETGYLYTGAFIGSLVGLFLSGLLTDVINKFMIRRNKGRYEPEFRILLVIPMFVFCTIGLFGFVITAANNRKYGWLIPDVFLAFIIIGMVLGTVASALYLIDAHRELAVEAFTCLLVFKNMFSFVLTYYAYDWVTARPPGGIKKVGIAIASVQVVVCAVSIPMYVFGKRNRSFFHRHDILRILHLR